jgi:hypothetical protein
MFLVAFLVLEVTVAPVAWSLLTEIGFGVQRIVWRVAPAAAGGLLAVIGLTETVAAWTFLVIAVVLVSSPLLQGWQERGLKQLMIETLSPRTETRRRFDEIVAQSFSAPDEGLPPR